MSWFSRLFGDDRDGEELEADEISEVDERDMAPGYSEEELSAAFPNYTDQELEEMTFEYQTIPNALADAEVHGAGEFEEDTDYVDPRDFLED